MAVQRKHLKWRHDIQPDDTHHDNIHHNATQRLDTEHNATQHNDTQHNGTQHIYFHHNNKHITMTLLKHNEINCDPQRNILHKVPLW